MEKLFKFAIPFVCFFIAIVYVSCTGYASNKQKETPESIALKDYKHSQYISHKQIAPVNLVTSTFSFPIYKTVSSQETLNISDISHGLLLTNERLWFMMNGEQPEGLIVSDDKDPIRTGGRNRSKDLYEIYQTINNTITQVKEIGYFEFEGQGIFVVNHGTNKDMYLSKSAAAILNLPAGQKISSNEVVLKMKNRISESS